MMSVVRLPGRLPMSGWPPSPTPGHPVHDGIQVQVVVEGADHIVIFPMATIIMKYGYSARAHR